MEGRWCLVGLALLVLPACGRQTLWLDYPLEKGTGTAFKVQVEGVEDPVHGVTERLTVAHSEKVRIVYNGKVVAFFKNRSKARACAFWGASSYLYTWFRFLDYDKNGEETRFAEFIGRFDPDGTFQVCKDITPLEDRYLTLMFSDVVNDSTFRFYRATGPKDTLEYLLVKISKCRTVDIKKWLKEEREAKAVPASFRATPQGAEAKPPPSTPEPR